MGAYRRKTSVIAPVNDTASFNIDMVEFDEIQPNRGSVCVDMRKGQNRR